MFNSREKILKKDEDKTDLEEEVAKIIYDLQMKSEGSTKQNLVQLYLTGATNVDFTDRSGNSGKALLVRIPYRSLPSFRKTRGPVVSALEKKFKNTHVIVAATRTIQSKFLKTHRSQMRPRTRTLTSVHDALLEDVVSPAQIVGKHTRVSVNGNKIHKIFLDPLDKEKVEDKLDAFTETYRKLTHKKVQFEFSTPTPF